MLAFVNVGFILFTALLHTLDEKPIVDLEP